METEGKKPKIALTSVSPEDQGEKPKYKLNQGKSYLIEDDSPKKAYDIFVDAVNNNMPGLIITRRKPDEVRKRFGLAKTLIIWLRGEKSDEPYILASDLGEIYLTISDFVDNNRNGIIFLEGIEYLINNNDFRSVTQMIEHIDDVVSVSDACFLLLTNPKAFEEKDLSFLEEEIEYQL